MTNRLSVVLAAALLGVLVFSASLAAGYNIRLAYGPWALMRQTYEQWSPANTWFHDAEEPDAENWVKIANPDALISRATYDLSDGPLYFEGQLPEEEYWSLSFYDGRSVNIATISDAAFGSGRYHVLLVEPRDLERITRRYPETPVVASRSERGYAVVRLIINRGRPLSATASVQSDAQITGIE